MLFYALNMHILRKFNMAAIILHFFLKSRTVKWFFDLKVIIGGKEYTQIEQAQFFYPSFKYLRKKSEGHMDAILFSR